MGHHRPRPRRSTAAAPPPRDPPPAPDPERDRQGGGPPDRRRAQPDDHASAAGAVDAGAEVLALAELLQAPVDSFRSGRGIVSDDMPWGFDLRRRLRAVAALDVLIGIGTRMELQ